MFFFFIFAHILYKILTPKRRNSKFFFSFLPLLLFFLYQLTMYTKYSSLFLFSFFLSKTTWIYVVVNVKKKNHAQFIVIVCIQNLSVVIWWMERDERNISILIAFRWSKLKKRNEFNSTVTWSKIGNRNENSRTAHQLFFVLYRFYWQIKHINGIPYLH